MGNMCKFKNSFSNVNKMQHKNFKANIDEQKKS